MFRLLKISIIFVFLWAMPLCAQSNLKDILNLSEGLNAIEKYFHKTLVFSILDE